MSGQRCVSITAALIVWACQTSATDGPAVSLVAGLPVVPAATPVCVCETGADRNGVECAVTPMPSDAAVCQIGNMAIYCAFDGRQPQTFVGGVDCDTSFCVSYDRETCVIACDCFVSSPRN